MNHIRSWASRCGGAILMSTALLTTPFAAVANEVEASLSDALVDFRFTSDFEQDFMGRFAIMHSEDDEAAGNDVDANLISYTFGSHGQRDRFDISLGGRVFFMDIDVDVPGGASGNGLGLALGFGVSAELLPKLSAGIEAYYSPDVLTGGDLDSTLDTELRVSYQVIDNGSVFVGYRLLEAEVNDDDGDVYDGGVLGMRLSF